MTEAYLYVDSDKPSSIPHELVDLPYIDRFGVEAVYGRKTLSAKEIRNMLIAENVVNAYNARRAAMGDNVAKWASENESAARLLSDIEDLLDGEN